jgi:hypothetical protein
MAAAFILAKSCVTGIKICIIYSCRRTIEIIMLAYTYIGLGIGLDRLSVLILKNLKLIIILSLFSALPNGSIHYNS